MPLDPESARARFGHATMLAAEREAFAAAIDRDLTARNHDYRDHRAGGFGLRAPQISVLPNGGFAEWMRRRDRLGSQNKVPRVVADPGLLPSCAPLPPSSAAPISARQAKADQL